MNLVMKYSTHLLTIFAICICIWGILNSNELSEIQIVMIGFGIIITLHEWEEMHWPGGFMEMMGDIIGWDISGIRQGAEHTSQSFFIALIILLPVVFPTTYWLFCGVMIFGIIECVAHVGGIKMAKTNKPYTPGMATGIIMMIYCIWGIIFVSETETIPTVNWLLGFIFFVVWFFLMQQMVMTFCRFDHKEFMKAMMGMAKSRLKK